MVGHMKTTVNLPDELVREAQELARREGTTLKELIETGLRGVLTRRRAEVPFVLADASVGGRGLSHEYREVGWDGIRGAIYPDPHS